MAALPTVGGSDGTWGAALNAFLEVGHDADGTHTKAQMLADMGWSPTAYAGEESVTLPNGCIIKQGTTAIAANAGGIATFAVAFPTACTRVIISPTINSTVATLGGLCWVQSKNVEGIVLFNAIDEVASVDWIAIGY